MNTPSRRPASISSLVRTAAGWPRRYAGRRRRWCSQPRRTMDRWFRSAGIEPITRRLRVRGRPSDPCPPWDSLSISRDRRPSASVVSARFRRLVCQFSVSAPGRSSAIRARGSPVFWPARRVESREPSPLGRASGRDDDVGARLFLPLAQFELRRLRLSSSRIGRRMARSGQVFWRALLHRRQLERWPKLGGPGGRVCELRRVAPDVILQSPTACAGRATPAARLARAFRHGR